MTDPPLLQEDLHTLGDWAKLWQMKFNSQKCFVMRITHARSTVHYYYPLGGDSLTTVENHSYLGVQISNKLNWNNHIQGIWAKANRS